MTLVSNLEVRVGIDISDFTRGMSAVDNKIESFGKSVGTGIMALGSGISTIGDKMSSLGASISSATRPLTDLANSGLEAAAGFQDIMVQLQTFGGLTGKSLEDVRQKALQLGADTKYSASDAANAMLELVKAGYDTKTAMQDAGVALNLAAVGGMNLEQAAGIVSSTISQFNLDPIDEANMVLDSLAAGANASRADVSDLADGLKNVGVVASTMGFSLQDTTAALAVMSNAGIEGAEAGTQLKSALINLSTSTTAKDALVDLGVSLYDANGKMKDMDTIIDQLSASMKDFTPEEKTQTLKDLGGSFGITALSALMAAGGVDTMVGSMNAAPAASDIAEKSMGTFNGTVESLKGSVETLLIQGLTPLMENGLTPLVSQVTEVVNSITDWAGKNPEVASTIGAIVLGVGALGAGLAILGPIVGLIGTAIAGFGTLITVATGPIGLLTLGIAGLIALLSSPDIQNGLKAWQGVFDKLKIILGAIADDMKSRLDDVAVNFRGFVRDITTVIEDLKSKAAAAQIVLGINVDANSAQVTESTSNIQAADIAKKLEATVNSQLANGEPIKVDVPTLVNVEAMGETDRLVKQIVDPTAIQQAIDAAISSGDVATVQALLPISMKLAVDPAEQMRTLLSTALDAGGENSPVFNVLTQMATELQIDTKEIVAQYDHALKQAAGSQVYTVDVHVKVNPLLDTSGIVPVATAAATNAANSATASGVPQYASGGFTRSEGFAYLHANELILNPQQQMALSRGGAGSGSSVYNMTVIGQSPYEVANMVGRATREQDR